PYTRPPPPGGHSPGLVSPRRRTRRTSPFPFLSPSILLKMMHRNPFLIIPSLSNDNRLPFLLLPHLFWHQYRFNPARSHVNNNPRDNDPRFGAQESRGLGDLRRVNEISRSTKCRRKNDKQ